MTTATNTNHDALTSVSTLHQKYERVRNAITQAQKQAATKRAELESIQQLLLQCETDRNEMEAKLTNNNSFPQEDIQEWIQKQRVLDESLRKATMGRDELDRHLELVNRLADEQQRDFLQSCRDFRVACKRIRLSDTSAEVQEDDDDTELQVALQKANNAKHERQVVEAVLYEELAEKRQAAMDRAAEQSSRIEMQRGQLQRIQKDSTDMGESLSKLLRQVRNAQEMRDNFMQVASQRKQQQRGTAGQSTSEVRRRSAVTPSPATTTAPRNPYANNNNKSSNPYSSKSNSYSNSSSNNNPYSSSNNRQRRRSDALERQHPHRAGGRIRVDRQFSTALEIVSGQDHEEEEEESGMTSEQENKAMDHDKSTTDPTTSAADDSTRPAAMSMSARLKAALEAVDEDDEDDDELLSYVAFSK